MVFNIYSWLSAREPLLAILGEPYALLGIESCSAACKADALPAVLSVWPYAYFFCCVQLGIALCYTDGLMLNLISEKGQMVKPSRDQGTMLIRGSNYYVLHIKIKISFFSHHLASFQEFLVPHY